MMLDIIQDITNLVEHLVERQDVKVLAWHSNISARGMTNVVIVHTSSQFYEVWEHQEGKGFVKILERENTIPPEELLELSTDNARYNSYVYTLVCSMPQTSLERDEIRMKLGDYVMNTFRAGLFTETQLMWSTDLVRHRDHSGGEIYISGLPFYARGSSGWVWSAGSPIKRAGIVTELSLEET